MNARSGVGSQSMGIAGLEGDSSSHGRSPLLGAEEPPVILRLGQ